MRSVLSKKEILEFSCPHCKSTEVNIIDETDNWHDFKKLNGGMKDLYMCESCGESFIALVNFNIEEVVIFK